MSACACLYGLISLLISSLLTLCKTKRSIDSQLHVSIELGTVDDGLVGPHAEPVVVCQRGSLLESVQEENGYYQSQADGAEVLDVQLQFHLEGQRNKKK